MSATKDHIKLLSLIRKGDEGAFRSLYIDYFRMVEYLVVNNGGSKEMASDIFQDTLIVLIERASEPSFKLTCTLKTYIYSVARNLLRTRLRKKDSQNLSIRDFEEHIPTQDRPDLIEKKEARMSIAEKSMEMLGDPCKKLLNSFYYFGQSMKEIAQSLGYKDTNAAKSQKYKCLKRLRKIALELEAKS